MTEIIAGIEIPGSAAAAEATELVRESTNITIFDHSRRVFLFGMAHARRLGLTPDPELLYLSAIFHDTGLSVPYATTEQRFELDGADAARTFLLDRGYSNAAADVVWMAIALHTTPGIPARMRPEIAATSYGVLTDMTAWRLDELPRDVITEITAAHPRTDFENQMLRMFFDGMKERPDTTYGTVSADVLEYFDSDFHRTSMINRVLGTSWPGPAAPPVGDRRSASPPASRKI